MSKENFPRGWHLRKEFVDPETGDVYEFGKLKSDTPPANPTPDTPATQTEPTKPDTQVMSSETMQMQQQINELRRMLLQQQSKPTSISVQQEKVPFGEYDDSRIPDKENDFLTPPVEYIKHGKGYALSVYFNRGQQILAPHNIPIYFNKEFDEVTYHDGNAKIVPFSRFVCNSKADMEFIEGSPHYGVTIFRGLQNAKNVDLSMIDKYEGSIITVQRMTDEQLMANCVSKGIDLRQPQETLKAQLIKRMITDLNKQEEQLIGARQEEMVKEVMSPPTV